jgi:nucleoid-associated protein YgaU
MMMITQTMRCLIIAALGLVALTGCGQRDSSIEEEENSNYQRGRDLLKQGRDEEAMEEFVLALRSSSDAPQTNLELGRLFLQVESRKDPLQAIFHFRQFLRFRPEAREANNVRQLIATAEKQFLAGLPGKPFADQLEVMKLRESNQALEGQVASLKARLAVHEPNVLVSPSTSEVSGQGDPSVGAVVGRPQLISPKQETYVVKQGDNLSGISLSMYGSARYIDAIYDANRQAMANKNSLKVGQQLAMPKVSRP